MQTRVTLISNYRMTKSRLRKMVRMKVCTLLYSIRTWSDAGFTVIITCDLGRIIDNVKTIAITHEKRPFPDVFGRNSSTSSSTASRSVAPSWSVVLSFSVAVVYSSAVPQAFFDTCHSGTMLDLPHYHCNDIYVPWISKGNRRTKTMQNKIGKSPRSHSVISTLTAFPSAWSCI
jgi:hypothetical protein